ncbi:hypothetical protein MVEN_02647900 [Mycena venus]|uniref:Uncharacterized protein n=1 Tax=Mycena venus TaxID=2733690 RepID=A0A8H6TX08_9AGAR|nr:hypothetical protein MVEN_02647900 [Mycena venus]
MLSSSLYSALTVVIGLLSMFFAVDLGKNGLAGITSSLSASFPGPLSILLILNLLVLNIVLLLPFLKTIGCKTSIKHGPASPADTSNCVAHLIDKELCRSLDDCSFILILLLAVHFECVNRERSAYPMALTGPDPTKKSKDKPNPEGGKVDWIQFIPGSFLDDSPFEELAYGFPILALYCCAARPQVGAACSMFSGTWDLTTLLCTYSSMGMIFGKKPQSTLEPQKDEMKNREEPTHSIDGEESVDDITLVDKSEFRSKDIKIICVPLVILTLLPSLVCFMTSQSALIIAAATGLTLSTSISCPLRLDVLEFVFSSGDRPASSTAIGETIPTPKTSLNPLAVTFQYSTRS